MQADGANGLSASAEVRNFNWLLSSFVDATPGVTDAVAVSSDGLLMAMSSSLERAGAEQLSAIIAGMTSLAESTARCFALGNLDEGLDATFAEGHELVGREAAGEALGAGEAYAIDFKAVAIKQMDACNAKHAGELVLVATLVVVVAQHGDDGDVDVFEDGEAGAHFFGKAVISEVAGDDERVRQIVDGRECAHVLLVILLLQVDVGNGCQSHGSPPDGSSWRKRDGWRSQYSW